MGKKKKKGDKGKAKGDKNDGGLPPPPEFSQNRQGALEAMLAFRIKGKEGGITQCSEEAEVFKDRNYHQLSKNDEMKGEQVRYLKRLLDEAKEFAERMQAKETITRGDVELAMQEKLHIIKSLEDEEKELNSKIKLVDEMLESKNDDLTRMRRYQDEIQFERKEQISEMKHLMEKWEYEHQQLKEQISSELEVARHKVDQKLVVMSELQREKTAERLMHAMDKETKDEIADNLWLKEQISSLQATELRMQREVSGLEDRNLKLMTLMYNERRTELEATQRLISIPVRHTNPFELPKTSSNVSLSSKLHPVSSDTMVSHPIDIGMMSVEGLSVPIRPAPDHLHLPPIEEQRNQSLPMRANWPVTGQMLKSIAIY